MRILLTNVSDHGGKNGNPVELVFARVKPDHALFFVSRESLSYARTIARQSYLSEAGAEFIHIDDPFDLEQCYDSAVWGFDKAVSLGDNPWLHVDITAGTKPMSMALLLRGLQLVESLDERLFVSYVEQDSATQEMRLRYLPDKRLQLSSRLPGGA